MNEFALASNRTITLPLGEWLAEVRQVVMAEFDQFVGPAHTIKAALDQLQDKNQTAIIQAFLNNSAETTQLLIMLSSLTVEQIGTLTQDDPGSIMQLVYALYSLNGVFFDEVIKPQRKAKNEKKSPWWDGFQFLISQGHRHSEIMQYTYGTYLGYMDAAGQSYRHNLRMQANMIRTAHHANKQGMDKFNRELSKD